MQIEYTAWSLSVPERVRFRYRLRGVDKDWQDVGGTRTATYTNLDPGMYHFEVIASKGDGKWSPHGEKLDFYIAPAFYQATWFRALEMLAGLALIWLFLRLRIRLAARKIEDRMTERLQERDRIARELHDTLLQGFQGLVLQFQLAVNATPTGERFRTMMEQTLKRADLVLSEGRDRVLDLRSTEEESRNLPELVAKIGTELSTQFGGNFSVEVHGQSRPLNSLVRDEFHAIAKEALTNSFRHAQASEIVCEIEFGRNQFRLACTDNGIGIPAAFLSKAGRDGHWGLIGMRERAEKLGARISFSRGSTKGTTAELTIVARIAYVSTGKRSWWNLSENR